MFQLIPGYLGQGETIKGETSSFHIQLINWSGQLLHGFVTNLILPHGDGILSPLYEALKYPGGYTSK